MSNPTNQQREKLKNHKGPLEIVQFIETKDTEALEKYLRKAELTVQEVGGSQMHVLQINQVLSGMSGNGITYSVLTIDHFQNSGQLLNSYDKLAEERSNALSSTYALILKPEQKMLLVKRLKFLAPLLQLRFKIGGIGKFDEEVQLLQPERNATAESIRAFQDFDQQESFYNINLNKYFPVPLESELSIEEHYAEFSKETARVTGPRVISIGAYPTISGKIIDIFTEDKQQQFHDKWDQFLLVYYPKREDYLRLITHLPIEIIEKRNKAYERAMQISCTRLLA